MESDSNTLPMADRAWDWLEANRKNVIIGCLAVAIIGLGIGLWFWAQDQKQSNANAALSQVSAIFNSTSDMSGPLMKVAAEHPGTDAGQRALLLAGGELYAEGKYDDALGQFQKYMREYPETPFSAEAQFGIAACLDAQGKTDQALAAYKDVSDRHPLENVALPARLAMARLYESQNKLAEARDLYEAIGRANQNKALGAEATSRYIDLITRHPELAPKPTAPAGAAPGTRPMTMTPPAKTP
jgi:predicted negative regulator of RcsB-dependent stress response